MRIGLILALVFCLPTCGVEPKAELATIVSVHGLLSEDVRSLSASVLAPMRSDDVWLTCLSLRMRDILVTDPKIERLANAEAAVEVGTAPKLVIKHIEAGKDRLVYVEALGQSGELVGNGCQEYVTVVSGKTIPIKVDVYPITPAN